MPDTKTVAAVDSGNVDDFGVIHWVRESESFDLSPYEGYPARLLRHLIFLDGEPVAPSTIPDHWLLRRCDNTALLGNSYYYFFREPLN